MAIEKLDKSELYCFPVTDLETATAEETAGGITLPVIVVSNGVLTYKVVATKTWSDYVATTTADAISAVNAKVDAAVKDSQAKTAAAVNSANDAATRAGSAAQDAQVAATAYQRAKSEVEQLKTDTAAMEQRVAGVGTIISNAEAATAKAESTASHPGYVDGEGYYYKWDAGTGAYSKTTANLMGPKGEKGDTGATGPQGPQGEQGIQGEKGDTGATGPQGPKGDKGETGAQGPKGETGGIPSIKVAAGAHINTPGTPTVTINGETFTFDYLKGEKGDKGETGAQGPKGETGGIPSIKAAAGAHINTPGTPTVTINGATFTFDYLKGEKGEKGDTGATGPQGPKGETGAQGPKGEKGDTGAQGPKGEKGDPGTTSWEKITGKPTIPTVNDSVITVKQGGTRIASFSLNQSTGATINLQEGKIYSNATQTSDGLMSSADKKKLDGIGTGIYLTQEDGDKRYMLKGASNEAVIITVESPDGKGDLSGAVIDLVKADDNTPISEVTYNGSPLTVQVPGGVTYKVVVKKIATGYALPVDQRFLAVADTTRNVRIAAIPFGVYIEMTDGSLVTADNYNGGTYASNKKVNSIIIATANWTGRILPDADLYSEATYWTPSEPDKQVSKYMSDNPSAAETDMDGAGNTKSLLDVYGSGVTYNFAAGYAYNKTFRSGKHGYLPALGELKMIYANATEVNKCLAKLIGQSDCIGGHLFWSSTQKTLTSAWHWRASFSDWNSWKLRISVLVLSAL